MSVVAGWVEAGAADLGESAMRQLALPCGRTIAVYRIEGVLYATDDVCSHGQSSLTEEGELDGCKIVCGWHFGAFDVRTGEALDSPAWEPLRTYRVEERAGTIFVAAHG